MEAFEPNIDVAQIHIGRTGGKQDDMFIASLCSEVIW